MKKDLLIYSAIFLFALSGLFTGCADFADMFGPESKSETQNKSAFEVTASKDKMETIDLSWNYNGSEIPAYYIVKCGTKSSEKIYGKTNYSINLLRSGWTYEITVKGYNSIDKEICSDTIQVTTAEKYIPDLDFKTGEDKNTIEIFWRENGCDFKKQILYYTLDKNLPVELWSKVCTKTSVSNSLQETSSEYTYDSDKTHYFKLVCYTSDRDIFGEKDFSFNPGILAPKAIESKFIDIKTGVTSVKVTIDISNYKSKVDKFIVEGLDNSYYSKKNICKTVEIFPDGKTVNCTLAGLAPESDVCVRVTAVNESGKESTTCTPVKTGGYIKSEKITAIPGQADAAIYADLDCDYVEEDLDISYSLTEYKAGERKIIVDPQKDKVIKYTNLKPGTLYIPDYTININYKDAEENPKLFSSYAMASFSTNGYDAPSNFVCAEAKTNKLTFTFDELTAEQTFGYDVSYELEFFDGSTLVKKLSGKDVKSAGTTVTGLNKGKQYKAVLKAVNVEFNSKESRLYSAAITVNTLSGLSKLKILTCKETLDILPLTSKVILTWNKLAEDNGDVTYGIEFKIFKGSSFKHYSTYQYQSKDEQNPSFEKYILVNSGNRYIIRLYAFKDSDPEDISYSDEIEYQLEKVDDSKIYGGPVYTKQNTIGATPGDLVNLTDAKIWKGNKEIRSSEKDGYNWGLISFLDGEMDPLKYGLSAGKTTFNSVKMSYEKVLDSSNQRVLFYDRRGVIGSEMAFFDIIYFVKPDQDGTVIKKIEEKSIDGKTVYISELVNMPFFGAGTNTTTHPSEAGLPVDEEWMFNNSIYIGVKQSTQGYLGFSYYSQD